MGFDVVDYCVFGFTLVVSAAIGTYYRFTGGKQKTNEEYLWGDRNQNFIYVAVSLMASFMSSISMLGGSAEVYNFGTHFYVIDVGYQIGIVVALLFYIPVFLELESVSVYEYLELRFGKVLRVLASLAFIIQMILYMSVVLVAPSIALQIITKMSYVSCIIIVGLVCTFYSTIGGIKAVIFTDLFQSALMFISLFCIFLNGYQYFGSLSRIFEIANENGRIDFFNFDPTIRHTWFSTVIGGIIQSIMLNGINQTQIQRYRTMKDRKTVNKAVMCFGPILIAFSFCSMLSGLVVFARYYNCDPLKLKKIIRSDQLLPFYVIDNFTGSGLSGLFVAGIFSAALSTISPLLNSLAAVTMEDYFKPIYSRLSKATYKSNGTVVPQILSLFYGCLCVIVALISLNLKSILTASIVIFNVVGGPVLGIFSLGLFVPWANEGGTIVGFISGLILSTWISTAEPRPSSVPLPTSVEGCTSAFNETINVVTPMLKSQNYPYLFRISYMFYGFIGFSMTILIGIGASLLMRCTSKKFKAELLYKSIAKRLIQKQSSLIYLEKPHYSPLSQQKIETLNISSDLDGVEKQDEGKFIN